MTNTVSSDNKTKNPNVEKLKVASAIGNYLTKWLSNKSAAKWTVNTSVYEILTHHVDYGEPVNGNKLNLDYPELGEATKAVVKTIGNMDFISPRKVGDWVYTLQASDTTATLTIDVTPVSQIGINHRDPVVVNCNSSKKFDADSWLYGFTGFMLNKIADMNQRAEFEFKQPDWHGKGTKVEFQVSLFTIEKWMPYGNELERLYSNTLSTRLKNLAKLDLWKPMLINGWLVCVKLDTVNPMVKIWMQPVKSLQSNIANELNQVEKKLRSTKKKLEVAKARYDLREEDLQAEEKLRNEMDLLLRQEVDSVKEELEVALADRRKAEIRQNKAEQMQAMSEDLHKRQAMSDELDEQIQQELNSVKEELEIALDREHMQEQDREERNDEVLDAVRKAEEAIADIGQIISKTYHI